MSACSEACMAVIQPYECSRIFGMQTHAGCTERPYALHNSVMCCSL